MSENVVSLSGEPVRNSERQPVQTVVEALEEILARARSGEVRGVAIAYAVKRNAGRNWISDTIATGDDDAADGDLLVATCRMKRRLEAQMFADADD